MPRLQLAHVLYIDCSNTFETCANNGFIIIILNCFDKNYGVWWTRPGPLELLGKWSCGFLTDFGESTSCESNRIILDDGELICFDTWAVERSLLCRLILCSARASTLPAQYKRIISVLPQRDSVPSFPSLFNIKLKSKQGQTIGESIN